MRSKVEEKVLTASDVPLRYPAEKIGVIVVKSFPVLGKLTALRFLEWVQENPEGVVSLPTGKTPEYFIKETNRYLRGWKRREIQRELRDSGIETAKKPNLRGLHFVQIDEFYPINPLQHNSFYYYVRKYYLEGFGLDQERALLINCDEIGLRGAQKLEEVWPEGVVDLSLRHRHPLSRLETVQKCLLERIDEWCIEYEGRIRELGGIGFFLGGIGPDGHIGFNIRGSDFFSTTRLMSTNYETQAAAAQDLGGMEVARKSLVITIGLSTIVHNPDCVALIIAAGEAKATIVAASIEGDRSIHFPATVLHGLTGSRFFLTSGASKNLTDRNLVHLQSKPLLEREEVERIMINISLARGVPIHKLKKEDLEGDSFGRLLLEKSGKDFTAERKRVVESLIVKLEQGVEPQSNRVFLHTEPHHDDIMLGYLPGVVL